MDNVAALSATIGSRVRQARQGQGWTLDQLAQAAGVSRRMVVNVEQGSANPSVATLLRLSDALGLGLPALVERPQSDTARVTRAGEGAVLWRGPGGGRGILVAGTGPPDVVELWDWTLGPGDHHQSEAHAAGTRELLQLHEGGLTVTVAQQTHDLVPGDAITFAGDVPHGYEGTGDATARFSLTVFEPGVGPVLRTTSAKPTTTDHRSTHG